MKKKELTLETHLNFPRPPLSEEVAIIGIEEIEASCSTKRKVRYILESVTDKPSANVHCSCEKSQKLGQKITKAGFGSMKDTPHGTEGKWEIETTMKAQRWVCKRCTRRFHHEYSFMEYGKRYPKHLTHKVNATAKISSAAEAARLHGVPTRTVHTMFYNRCIPEEAAELKRAAIKRAQDQGRRLVLSADEKAIRKGRRYMTYIYDDNEKNQLAVIEGRSYEDLMTYWEQNPDLHSLDPYIIVIDRAPSYIKFFQKVFPNARIVFDRFHVIKNVRELVLNPTIRATLKDERFAPMIKEQLLDLLRKALWGELSSEEKDLLKEMLKHLETIKKKYDKIAKRLLLHHEKLESSLRDDFPVSYEQERQNLYEELNNFVNKEFKKAKYLSKLKASIRKSLDAKYREELPKKKKLLLEKVLQQANWHGLREAYECIEEVGRWYNNDYSTFIEAYNVLLAMIEMWLRSNHKGIKKGARSLKRGLESIANYHYCNNRATNGATEGRNNSTRVDTGKRYGLRNKTNYINLSYIRFNYRLRDDYNPRLRSQ